MPVSRRDLLHSLSVGAAMTAVGTVPAQRVFAQTSREGLVARVRSDLERHASFGEKFSGGPGDTATAQWIAGRLRDLGYAVLESSFGAPFFTARETTISVGDLSVAVDAQAPVVTTAADGIRARLALVEGSALDVDVRNRIAVVVLPFGRHAALFTTRGIGVIVNQVAQAGAAALVIVTTGPTGEAVALNAPEEPFVDVPTAVLAPSAAGAVVAAARDGREATLVLDGEATHRPSINIVARLERGSRWFAMSTPRSGWYGSVAERGTGTAAFLEIAAWAKDRFPDHSVFLMNTGGHEYFFAGSHRVLHEAPDPRDTAVWAHIGATLASRDAVQNEDGSWRMLDTADPQRFVMASAHARAAVKSGFGHLTGYEEPREIVAQTGELSTFTDMGFERAFAALGVHRWFHARSDTLERTDARLVVPVLEAHQRTIESIITEVG